MAKRRRETPDWRDWDLELWNHLEERMEERPFTETDLRLMIDEASSYKKARRPGRWILETKHLEHRWHVIVRPDYNAKVLEVITAYQVERKETDKKRK